MSPRRSPGCPDRTPRSSVSEPSSSRGSVRNPSARSPRSWAGRVASALDNSMMESFFGTLQLELLDRQSWTTRAELARAIFERIEGWYNRASRAHLDRRPQPYGLREESHRRHRCGMMPLHRNTPGNRARLGTSLE